MSSNPGIAISPVDGRYLWTCTLTDTGSATIWATQDMVATWQQVATFTPTTAEPARWCTLVASQNDPHTLAVVFSWGAGVDNTLRSISYLSADGGVHWQRLAGEIAVSAIGKGGSKTYAILRDTAADPANQQGGLVVSADGLQSWRIIHPTGLAANDGFFKVWLNSSTGELLAPTVQNTLWRTQDAGASWLKIMTPNQQTSLGA